MYDFAVVDNKERSMAAKKKPAGSKPFAGQTGRKPRGGQGYGTSTGSAKTGGVTKALVAPGSKVVQVQTTKSGGRSRKDLDVAAQKVGKSKAANVGTGKLVRQTPIGGDENWVWASYGKGSQNPSRRDTALNPVQKKRFSERKPAKSSKAKAR